MTIKGQTVSNIFNVKRVLEVLITLLLLLTISACSGKEPEVFPDRQSQEATVQTEKPVLTNSTGKTMIQHISQNKKWFSDFMITSKMGTTIIIDAFETPEEIIDNIKPDIITVTHMQHIEHVDENLINRFRNDNNCRLSLQKPESFTWKDIKVTGIPASHSIDLGINNDNPDNVIYVFEIDGLRIAALGGVGQESLTKEQMERLGKIDIAFIEFVTYRDPYMAEENCIKVAKQLNPKIIIPTHRNSDETIKKLSDSFGALERIDNKFITCTKDLENCTLKLVDIENTLYE